MRLQQVYYERDATYLLRLFSDTLEFRLHSCGMSLVKTPFQEPWGARPTTYIGQIEHAPDTIRFKDMPPVELGAGDAVILPPNTQLSHDLHDTPQHQTRIRWSHFQFSVLHSVDIFTFLKLPATFSGKRAKGFGDFNEALVDASQTGELPPLMSAVKLKQLAFKMLETVLDCVPLKDGAMATLEGLQRFEPVLEHIKKNYVRQLTVETLAKKAGMSPSRFHAVFKEALGMAPIEYVIGLRIEQAQHLLGFSPLSIGEIAAQCGYEDQLYFSKVFKGNTGSTPTRYRDNVRATMGEA